MSTIADLLVKLMLDSTAFNKGIEDANKSAANLGKNLTDTGAGMVKTGGMISLAMAPAALMYKGMIGSATDLGEQQAKTNQIFQESAGQITEWADTTTTAFGISNLEALEYAGNYGNILTNMGFTNDEAASYSKTLIELAADQGAFNNLGTEDVLTKIESALVGIYMPARSLGIVMSESSVQAKAMEMGLADANGELSTSALVQARVAMLIEQSGNAMGQFARESDGLAATQKITNAQFSDLKAELGTMLLPVMLQVMQALQKMIGWFSGLSPAVQKTVLAIGGILIVVGPVLVILGTLLAAVGTITTFLAGPAAAAIGGVVAAFAPVLLIIAAVIAIVILVKRAWDTNFGGIQEKTAVVINFMKEKLLPIFKNVADFVGGALTGAFNGVAKAIQWVIDKVKSVIDWFKKVGDSLPDWLVPGSPTPFEMGLRGIGSALDSLKNKDFMVNASASVATPSGNGIANELALQMGGMAQPATAREIAIAVRDAIAMMA